jgi:hypothetical protein
MVKSEQILNLWRLLSREGRMFDLRRSVGISGTGYAYGVRDLP